MTYHICGMSMTCDVGKHRPVKTSTKRFRRKIENRTLRPLDWNVMVLLSLASNNQHDSTTPPDLHSNTCVRFFFLRNNENKKQIANVHRLVYTTVGLINDEFHMNSEPAQFSQESSAFHGFHFFFHPLIWCLFYFGPGINYLNVFHRPTVLSMGVD